jgi:nucleoside-triphosphatase THEP1
MECFSDTFAHTIRRLLQSNRSVLSTVAQKGSGLIQEVKDYPGVQLLHLTRANRDEVTRRVTDMLAPSAG